MKSNRGLLLFAIATWLTACTVQQPSDSSLEWSTARPLTQVSTPTPLVDQQAFQSVSNADTETPHITGGIFTGSQFSTENAGHRSATRAAAKDVSINFVSADIHEVAKAILGDMLGLSYIISPSVTGTITLKIDQPLTRNEIISVLDTVFRLNGAALVSGNGIVKVVPANEVAHQGGVMSGVGNVRNTPGYGMQAVALHFIDATTMQKILTQVAATNTTVPVESTRNVLIITGTDEERTAMLQIIDTFDVDWLAGMSFGLFPLQEADATTMSRELWDVLGTQSGPLAKIIRIVPFDRLNAVLVVSSQPRYLREIKEWITRLDVNQAPSDRKIWVYRVQNGRAADLSNTLGKILSAEMVKVTGGNATTETSAASQQVAPVQPFSFETSRGKAGGSIPPPPTPSAFNQSPGNQAPSEQAQQSGPHVISDESTNSLIIWANKSEFSLIRDALNKLDITPLQVRIEAVVAEVTLTDDLSYGVQYLFQSKHLGTVLTNANNVSVTPNLPGFSAFITGSHINAILDLLRSVTTINVISSPQLMVLNNQSAMLQVGNQVPVATQSAVSTLTPGAPVVNSIQMVDTGVILKVTPRVNASGMVLMDIAQEVSDVIPTTTSTIDSPTIEERKIASSVAVRSGETIALGGLIQANVSNGKSGIPVLDDIPYVGNLFGTTTKNVTRTELIALLTPRVVKNDNDILEATAEMRQQMRNIPPIDASLH